MNSKDPRVRTAVGYIQQRYLTAFSFDKLAESVNLSSSRLRRLVKSDVGLPPSRYVKSLRMQKAKELLGSSFLSVKEIMGQVGYNDPSHFVRDFKTIIGMSPQQYRLLCHKIKSGR